MGCEAVEDPLARSALDAELGEQLPEQVGVAEADDRTVQADRVERGHEHLDQLRGPGRRLGTDQLDADLPHLTQLAALRADRPKDAARVGEPERSRLAGVAAGDQAGDRHRHVVAERQHRSRLVGEPVGSGPLRPVAAREGVEVLDRRRRDLGVAAGCEQLEQRRLDRAQLAHLLGEDVARAGGQWLAGHVR